MLLQERPEPATPHTRDGGGSGPRALRPSPALDASPWAPENPSLAPNHPSRPPRQGPGVKGVVRVPQKGHASARGRGGKGASSLPSCAGVLSAVRQQTQDPPHTPLLMLRPQDGREQRATTQRDSGPGFRGHREPGLNKRPWAPSPPPSASPWSTPWGPDLPPPAGASCVETQPPHGPSFPADPASPRTQAHGLAGL